MGKLFSDDRLRSRAQWPSTKYHMPGLLCAAENPLANSCPAALNQNEQYDYAKNTGDDSKYLDVIHGNSPFSQWLRYFLKDSIIMIMAGPRVTRKSDGKIKNTSGKTSFTVVFAACSSTFCRRWVRRVSA